MKSEYFISIYLDTRRELKNKKYPVKIRVFIPVPRKQKLYATRFEFTKKEFESIWETTKPNNKAKEERRYIQVLLDKAEDIAKQLEPFTFEKFEKELFQKSGEAENVFSQYEKAINQYKMNNQFGTASNYVSSQKSIRDFLSGSKLGRVPEALLFREITPDWLNQYENYMINRGKSITTIGIYLRPLRALFNVVIDEGVIKADLYPFGRRKYEIPNPKAVKKALSKEQLKKLFEAVPQNSSQAKAKDFWFFLFNCAGLNVKDMARLKYDNIQGDKLIYFREKTKRTSKANLKPVVVYLNDYAKSFIEKYGNPNKSNQNYIFDILKVGMTEEEKFKRAGIFTRIINENIKKLAENNGLPCEVSSYWSRHSFATNAIRDGASMEQISQALNHHDLSTTKNYFAGFEDEDMKKMSDKLMKFSDQE